MFDWITGMVEQTDYVGIAVLMLMVNVLPPIPSELIMPLAGFTTAPKEIDDAAEWFRRHSGKSVFFGRLIPAVHTLISVLAGVAQMSLVRFLAYSTLGTVTWTGFLAGAGHLLEGQYQKVSSWVNPVSNVIIGLIVVLYIYRVITFQPHEAQ